MLISEFHNVRNSLTICFIFVLFSITSIAAEIDFNGDGKADMLYRDQGSYQWHMLLMDGESIKSNTVVDGMSTNFSWEFSGIGDFNGDGLSDVIIRNSSSKSWYIYNLSGSNIISRGYVDIGNAEYIGVQAVADFNHDGYSDVLLRNEITGEWNMTLLQNRVVIETLSPPMSTVLGWNIIAAKDFDGNGSADILIRNANSGAWYIYLYEGTDIISRGYIGSLSSDLNDEIRAIADFDGDGKVDLLLRNLNSQQWTMIMMNGHTPSETHSLTFDQNGEWQFNSADDYNGDGKADIVLRNRSSNKLRTHLMDGESILMQEEIDLTLISTLETQTLLQVSKSLPFIEMQNNTSVITGRSFSFTANATDVDGHIESYLWTQTAGSTITLANTNTKTISFSAPATPGEISLTLTVTDNDGQSASSSIDINIIDSPYSASPHQSRFVDDQDLTGFFSLFGHNYLNRIEISISQTEWNAFMSELEADIKSDVYFESEVTITTARGAETIPQTGIRIRGNTTRQVPEQDGIFKPVHFKLKFNETFDLESDSLAYIVRQDRRFSNLKALNLKNKRPGYDDTHIRELYSYDLFNQIGVKAPLTTAAHVVLTIGNQVVDYGVYTAIEPIDKTFLRKRYGDDDNEGNLYKCLWHEGGPATLSPKHPSVSSSNWIGVSDTLGFDPTYNLKTNESTPDHTRIMSFIEQLNGLSGDSLKTYLDANMEIDDFLKYMAMNVLIGMPDDYRSMGNNYYLYFNNNGKIAFIPYDYDSGFGGGWVPFDTSSADIYLWENLSGPLSGDSYYDAHPLVDKVLEIDSYKVQYENYLSQYIDAHIGNFSFAGYETKFEQIKQLIDLNNDGLLESDVPDNVPYINLTIQEDFYNTKLSAVRAQLGL